MPIKSRLTKRGRARLRGKRIALRPKPFSKKPPPEPRPWAYAYMSSYEWQVFRALKKRGIAFTEQVSFGGGAGTLGGARVDFLLSGRNIIIRVQGPYHEMPQARSRDMLQMIYLQGQGYEVIDFWAEDLLDLDRALATKLGTPIRT